MNASAHLVVALLSIAALTEVGCSAAYGEADPASGATSITATDPSGHTGVASNGDKSASSPAKPAKPTTASTSTPSTTTATSTGASDLATAAAPAPSSVAISWNRFSPTAKYSLDLFPKDASDWIAPCVGVGVIGQDLSIDFSGDCVTPDLHVKLDDVRDFRICWAENDDWQDATCVNASWDHVSTSVQIAN